MTGKPDSAADERNESNLESGSAKSSRQQYICSRSGSVRGRRFDEGKIYLTRALMEDSRSGFVMLKAGFDRATLVSVMLKWRTAC
jgi:hypothetical protein